MNHPKIDFSLLSHFNLDTNDCSHPRSLIVALKPMHCFKCITCENNYKIHESICAGCAEKCHQGHTIIDTHLSCYFCACFENRFPHKCCFNQRSDQIIQRKRPFSMCLEIDGKKMAMTLDNSHILSNNKCGIILLEYEENCPHQQFIFDSQDNQEIKCIGDPKYFLEANKKLLWAARPTGRNDQKFNFVEGRLMSGIYKESYATYVQDLNEAEFIFEQKENNPFQIFQFVYFDNEEIENIGSNGYEDNYHEELKIN